MSALSLLVASSSLSSAEVVYFSLGCFWDKEFRLECAGLPSVDRLGTLDTACNTTRSTVSDRVCRPNATVVGYMGGTGDHPSYDSNYTLLNYSETVRLIYDPIELPFRKVMSEYWRLAPDAVDPQTNPAYFLRIFTTTPSQLAIAQASYKEQLVQQNVSVLFVNIQSAEKYQFWKAEEENQQYDFKVIP